MRFILLSSLLWGCADSEDPAWAFQHAVVSVDVDGNLQGFQTWELYSERWSRKLKEKFHHCAYVQEIEGTPLETPRCPGCVDGFAVTTTLADTDCAARWLLDLEASTASYELLIGDLPSAEDADRIAEDIIETVEGPMQGWYQRFGEGEALPQGYIWSESGASDALPTLVPDEHYILWSTSAWSLTE